MKKLQNISLPEREKKAIQLFSQRTKKMLGKQIVEIKLFGSKARGAYKKKSDIDIFILVKKLSQQTYSTVAKISDDVWWKYEIELLPVVYDLYEEKKIWKCNPLFLSVKKEGVVI